MSDILKSKYRPIFCLQTDVSAHFGPKWEIVWKQISCQLGVQHRHIGISADIKPVNVNINIVNIADIINHSQYRFQDLNLELKDFLINLKEWEKDSLYIITTI